MAYLLIVDDDPDFVGCVATVCRADGHEVETAHTPAQALAAVGMRRPDGIILDVMFPEDPTAGFQLAREIFRQHGDIPILLLTAVNQEFPLGFSDKDIEPRWLPVRGVIEKPVDLDLLRERVARLLAPKEANP
jgi:CheY-like chemotaxis protein